MASKCREIVARIFFVLAAHFEHHSRSRQAADGRLATLGIWLLAVPSGLLFLFRPGFFQALLDIARQTPAWKLSLLPPLAVLLLLATTWKQLVEGYWVALTGRPWLTNVFTIGVVLFVMFGVGFGIAAAIFPEYQAAAKTAVPWILGVLLVAKITVAIVVLRAIEQSGIMPIEFVVAAVGSWVLVVAVLDPSPCGWCHQTRLR